ncbi:TSUP family transporter [Nesterenkonia sp. MY13]|uniref:Probable membrane transporter protein n=1 Tax=Nesterenkonia sedimenti TaxID=1463632 RepID=A0A7X8YDA0_9MICC|nr:sulfite exporter TauE/SafE family protein [Nesterenkonia sedimenti]NLS08917.1 TSUP family transporter [Nesterenkonia sedimenti]
MGAELTVALAIIGLVVLAATLQRLTGIGFAMMMAPFLVVMIGPHGGVMLTNLLSFLAPALMIPVVWRDIEWRKVAVIGPAAVLVMPLFGWLAAISPQGPLYIVVASLVILGLSISLIVSRISAAVDGPIARVLTGVGAGGGVVLAGVGGPAMAIYSVVSRWDVRKFAATLQPLWVLMAVSGFLTKLTFSGNEIPAFPWWFWLGSLIAILVGMRIGTLVRTMISDSWARRIVIVLAFIGAGISLVMGIRETFWV